MIPRPRRIGSLTSRRWTACAAVGRIAIIVREGGAREDESSKSYALWNIWQPILVEHTVTQPDLTSLEVHVLRLGTTDGDDAFVFREAQLRQIIE